MDGGIQIQFLKYKVYGDFEYNPFGEVVVDKRQFRSNLVVCATAGYIHDFDTGLSIYMEVNMRQKLFGMYGTEIEKGYNLLRRKENVVSIVFGFEYHFGKGMFGKVYYIRNAYHH